MDRTPFVACLNANRPIPVPVVLILGSLVTGLALAGFAFLFFVGARS